MERWKMVAFLGLLALILICGTIVAVVTHDGGFFGAAAGTVTFLGLMWLIANE